MSIQLVSLVIAALVNSTLGIVGVYRKPRLQTWLFLLLLLSINGWLTATYLLLQYTDPREVTMWMGWIFAFVIIQNMTYTLFIFAQTTAKIRRRYVALYILASALLVGAALTGNVLTRHANGDMPGIGMPFFLLHFLLSVAAGFIRIVKSLRRETGYVRSQLDYLLFASLVLFTIVLLTNFVLPVAFGVKELLVFSPFFSIVASGLIVYAMLRHHLFDIRSFIIRAVAYAVLVALLFTFYVVVVLGLGTTWLNAVGFQGYVQLFYVIVTLLTAIMYAPIERYFRHITNKVFFQGAYDTRTVLSRFNTLLVRTTALGDLVHDSLTLLGEVLKPQYAGILTISGKKKGKQWLVGIGRRRLALDELAEELG